MFIYFWETECEQARGRERGSHRIKAGSRLWDVSTEPVTGLEPTNYEIMTWAEVGHLTDWATQAPPWFLSVPQYISYFLYQVPKWILDVDTVISKGKSRNQNLV